MVAKGSERLIHLEAARGIASLIVVVHHVVLAFAPKLKGGFAEGGLRDTPIYPLMNGTAAVVFFFALSGFVLTRSLYQSFDLTTLLRAVAKRLPRLMLPAGLTILAGFAIFYYLPHWHQQAARMSSSQWLASFANGARQMPPRPEILDALRQCLLVFFRFDASYYNSNLWTMAMEFYGSLLVFALTALLGLWHGGYWVGVAAHLAAGVAIYALGQDLMLAFPLGALVAWTYVHRPQSFALRSAARWVLGLMVLAGFSVENHAAFQVAGIAALVLLLAPGRMQSGLAAPWGKVLGTLSFPLYLVHMLVIMAVTSPVVVALQATAPLPRLAVALPVTLAAALVAAQPLVWLEARWLPFLNRAAQKLIRRRAA